MRLDTVRHRPYCAASLHRRSRRKVHETRPEVGVCECDGNKTRPHHRSRDSFERGGRELMEGTIGKEGEVEKENWGGKIVKKDGVKKGPIELQKLVSYAKAQKD